MIIEVLTDKINRFVAAVREVVKEEILINVFD